MAHFSSLSLAKQKRRKIDLSTSGCRESLWLHVGWFYNMANLLNPTELHPCTMDPVWPVPFRRRSSGWPTFVMPVIPCGLRSEPEGRSVEQAEVREVET